MSDAPKRPLEILEAYFAPTTHGDEALFAAARIAWRHHRRTHDEATRRSSTTMPAVTSAALDLEQAKNHARAAGDAAERGLHALGAISHGRRNPPDAT